MAHCEQGRPRDPRPHRVFHRSVNGPYTPLDATYAAARWGWYVAAFLVLGAGSYAPFLGRLRTGLDATHPALAVEPAPPGRGGRVAGELLRATLSTGWGRGWLRQSVMALLAAVAFVSAGRGATFGWMVAAAASGGGGFTAGTTGPAGTTPPGPGGAPR